MKIQNDINLKKIQRSARLVFSSKCDNKGVPSRPLVYRYETISSPITSLYIGGFSSDNSSLIGPYSFELLLFSICILKKHAMDILGPTSLANTLWYTLLNLPFVINCKNPKQNITIQNYEKKHLKDVRYIFFLNVVLTCLHKVSNVHHQSPRGRQNINPPALVVNLKTTNFVLQ